MPLWDTAFGEATEGVRHRTVGGVVADFIAPLANVVVTEVEVLLLDLAIGAVVDFVADVGVCIGASKGQCKLPIRRALASDDSGNASRSWTGG